MGLVDSIKDSIKKNKVWMPNSDQFAIFGKMVTEKGNIAVTMGLIY